MILDRVSVIAAMAKKKYHHRRVEQSQHCFYLHHWSRSLWPRYYQKQCQTDCICVGYPLRRIDRKSQ